MFCPLIRLYPLAPLRDVEYSEPSVDAYFAIPRIGRPAVEAEPDSLDAPTIIRHYISCVSKDQKERKEHTMRMPVGHHFHFSTAKVILKGL